MSSLGEMTNASTQSYCGEAMTTVMSKGQSSTGSLLLHMQKKKSCVFFKVNNIFLPNWPVLRDNLLVIPQHEPIPLFQREEQNVSADPVVYWADVPRRLTTPEVCFYAQ